MKEEKDTGLACLSLISRHFHQPAELSQLERACIVKPGPADETTILRAAGMLHLKARKLSSINKKQLLKLPLPAMLKMKQGNYLVFENIAKQEGELKLIVYDPRFSEEPLLGDTEKILDDFSGDAILFAHHFQLEESEKKEQPFGWSWFLPVIAKYRRSLLSVLGISILLQLLGFAFPLFSQEIIDKVLVHRSLRTLDILLIGMLLTAVFQHWFTALRGYLFAKITSRMDATLSSRLYRNVLHLTQENLDRWQAGDIVSRLGELETLRNFLTGSFLTFLLDSLFALVYLGILFLYSPRLTLIVVLLLPAFILLNVIAAPLYRKLLNRSFLIGAANRSFQIETLTGIRTIKDTATEDSCIRRYEDLLGSLIKAGFSVVKLKAATGSIGLFLQQLYTLLILWVGAIEVMDAKLTVGALIAFQMIAGQLIAPVMRIVDSWQELQQARVSMSRLGDLMDSRQEPAWNPARTTLPDLEGQIELSGVSFAYSENSRRIIKDMNLVIPAGLTVGIVGSSGSGKSTLTKLIQRLYLPQQGRILIDGIDTAKVEPAWLRRQIGVVLQDNLLFAGTVEENIRIALPNATHEQVEQAAKLAGAHEFIEKMPHGYDTSVGEGGSSLSGGQRQRIAIARAIMTNPKILIFDEATSALDVESERLVMRNIRRLAKGRTTLLIAHRLSTVRDADAIIVMDQGRIAEAGSHSELLRHQGLYYQLWQAQKG